MATALNMRNRTPIVYFHSLKSKYIPSLPVAYTVRNFVDCKVCELTLNQRVRLVLIKRAVVEIGISAEICSNGGRVSVWFVPVYHRSLRLLTALVVFVSLTDCERS